MKKFTVTLVALISSFLMATTAKAEVITEWSYSVASVFASWTGSNSKDYDADKFTARKNGQAGFTLTNSGMNLNWYSADNRNSSAVLSPVTNGVVLTNDTNLVDAFTMTHNNNVISTDSIKPSFMDIALTVTLSALDSNGNTVSFDVDMTISLGFIETRNVGTTGYAYTEDDIFFVMNIDSTVKQFEIDGTKYQVSLEGSFSELSGVHLDALDHYMSNNDIYSSWYAENGDNPIYGWYTLEKETLANTMQIGLQVQTVPTTATPEPATLALFATASLFGIPAYRRWKNKK